MVRKRYDSFQERLINIQPNKNSLLSPKTNNRKSGNWDAFKIEKNIVDFLKMQV